MVRELSLGDRFRGVILGTAVGDAIGLPAEGLAPNRARKLFHGRWRHRLVIGRGMVSDDTDHTPFVAQSLLAHPQSVELFAGRLAWCLRLWFLTLPAGIGFATLRAILRLWLGFSPLRSGVYSAGNGPAMRSAPLRAFFASSPGRRDDYVEAATRVTHTDPKALIGAAVQHDLSVQEFADSLGLSRGVTGYVYHTVPVVVYAWYRHFDDFEATVSAVLNCGGDADTTGAIAGALAGAVTGEQGIPEDWLNGLCEWPRGVNTMREIADRLAHKSQEPSWGAPVSYFWPGLLPRNLFLLAVVILHGLRRLAPPY